MTTHQDPTVTDEAQYEAQYEAAVSYVVKEQKVSTRFIQRHLQVGYNRAARLLERMVAEGIVTEPDIVGNRTVLMKSPSPPQTPEA